MNGWFRAQTEKQREGDDDVCKTSGVCSVKTLNHKQTHTHTSTVSRQIGGGDPRRCGARGAHAGGGFAESTTRSCLRLPTALERGKRWALWDTHRPDKRTYTPKKGVKQREIRRRNEPPPKKKRTHNLTTAHVARVLHLNNYVVHGITMDG